MNGPLPEIRLAAPLGAAVMAGLPVEHRQTHPVDVGQRFRLVQEAGQPGYRRRYHLVERLAREMGLPMDQALPLSQAVLDGVLGEVKVCGCQRRGFFEWAWRLVPAPPALLRAAG